MSSPWNYQVDDDTAPSAAGLRQKVVTGRFPRALLDAPSFGWFKAGYDRAQIPSNDSLKILRSFSDRLEILAFVGTWCGDCIEHLPVLVRIADEAQIPQERLILIGLDRSKSLGQALSSSAEQFKIERLPTFVILLDGQEIGRIVETPASGVLEDLAAILTVAHSQPGRSGP